MFLWLLSLVGSIDLFGCRVGDSLRRLHGQVRESSRIALIGGGRWHICMTRMAAYVRIRVIVSRETREPQRSIILCRNKLFRCWHMSGTIFDWCVAG